MTAGTYEIRNKLDGKAYGGSSGVIEQRWGDHHRMLRKGEHHCIHLQRAWAKYGEEAFEFIILEVIEDAIERLAAEQEWLDAHWPNCYNTARDAIAPMLGRTFTDEARQKLSASRIGNQNAKGYKHTEEWKQAQSGRSKGNQYCLGHKLTEDHKRNISASLTGELHPNWGKHPSEETRRKQSAAAMGNQNCLGYKHTPEACDNMSKAQMGKKHTEEHKHKNSVARKRYWARKRAMAGLSVPILLPNPSQPMLLYGGFRK